MISCSSTKLSYDLCTILRSCRKEVFRKPHRLNRQVAKESWHHPKKEPFLTMFTAYPTSCFKTEHLHELCDFIFNQLSLINLLLPSFLPPQWNSKYLGDCLEKHPAVNKATGRCLCVRCFKSVGFLHLVLPFVLDVQLLHDRVLFSGGTLATSTVEQQTVKDITS